MPRIALPYTVELDDGATHEIVADDRDWAALEVAEFPDRANLTRTRYMAWNNLRRRGLYKGPWEKFNERDCVAVTVVPIEGEDDDDPKAEPGHTAPSDAS